MKFKSIYQWATQVCQFEGNRIPGTSFSCSTADGGTPHSIVQLCYQATRLVMPSIILQNPRTCAEKTFWSFPGITSRSSPYLPPSDRPLISPHILAIVNHRSSDSTRREKSLPSRLPNTVTIATVDWIMRPRESVIAPD